MRGERPQLATFDIAMLSCRSVPCTTSKCLLVISAIICLLVVSALLHLNQGAVCDQAAGQSAQLGYQGQTG